MNKRQYIKYENYERNKLKYGHIATWALWNEEILKLDTLDVNSEYALRKELLIANSKEEYEEKGLDKLLHGDVVVLALNFSCPKESPKNPNKLVSILNQYKDEKYNRERYQALINLVKNDEQFTFTNMYGPAGRGSVNGSGYAKEFMKSKILNGAYMTDFVKVVEDNCEIIPAGIPESNSGEISVTSCLSKEKIHIQAKGLKEELDSLDIKPKVFILVHSKLNQKSVKDAITKELGYQPHFEYLYHYTPSGISYKKRGFTSYEEMYTSRIQEVVSNIEEKI